VQRVRLNLCKSSLAARGGKGLSIPTAKPTPKLSEKRTSSGERSHIDVLPGFDLLGVSRSGLRLGYCGLFSNSGSFAMLAAIRHAASLVSKAAEEYFCKVSNCALKASHLRFNLLSAGCFSRPQPPSQRRPSICVCVRERAPYFGALAIEPVESGTRYHVSIARRRNISRCAVKLQAEPIATPVPCWCHLCGRRSWRRGRALARYRPLHCFAWRMADQYSRSAARRPRSSS
jgi:hypothetical protein